MERFQDLKSESKKREGEKPFRNLPFWKKHWQIMKNNGFEELVTAEYKNKIEGTILVLFFNGNMIQHALANSPEKDLVGTFLTWNTIKWAQKMKFKTFDFAGVDPLPKTKKEKGIYFYAEKFGGKKINFFSYSKILNQKKYYLTSGLQNPKRIISKYQSYKDKKIIKSNESK
jgi:lipid II:glycine glycyltransferase (peptidoglycan interpeptide bridge formation enzyme)